MPDEKQRKIIPGGSGFFGDIAVRIKLVLRLMGDPRVSPFLKLMPIGSILYFIIPDLAIGPIDDVAIVWLGAYLFVELCPPQVVEEHRQALKNEALPGTWRDPVSTGEPPEPAATQPVDEDVVDGEFWEKK